MDTFVASGLITPCFAQHLFGMQLLVEGPQDCTHELTTIRLADLSSDDECLLRVQHLVDELNGPLVRSASRLRVTLKLPFRALLPQNRGILISVRSKGYVIFFVMFALRFSA
jgi:hypothetical protein